MKKILIITLILLLLCSCTPKSITIMETSQVPTECVNTTSETDSEHKERLTQAAIQLAYIGGDVFFEENDIVDIDNYIKYYSMFEFIDERGYIKDEIMKQQNNCIVCVSRSDVNDFFKRKFAFTYDPLSSDHICTHKDDCYDLKIIFGEFREADVTDISFNGDRVICRADIIYGIENYTYLKVEMCLENFEDDNYKYIYFRNISLEPHITETAITVS